MQATRVALAILMLVVLEANDLHENVIGRDHARQQISKRGMLADTLPGRDRQLARRIQNLGLDEHHAEVAQEHAERDLALSVELEAEPTSQGGR